MSTPIEAVELEYPVRIRRYEFIPDSGGAGKYRGGLTVRRDIEMLIDDITLARYGDRLRSDVLVLARHGARTSTSAQLLQAVSPSAAVVSRDDRFELSAFVTARLMDTPLYRTDRHGTITLLSGGEQLTIKTDR